MTIEKGAPWGRIALTPHDTVVGNSEEAVARAVADGARHVVLTSGDLLRAVGTSPGETPPRVGEPSLQLPCDAFEVIINDDVLTTAVSSVVVGTRFWPRLWISAGGFLGRLNVAPRAHPNDGLLDALEFRDRPRPRELLAIRRRMVLGDHLPHPLLAMHRQSAIAWPISEDSPGSAPTITPRRSVITVDGRRFSGVYRASIAVKPDAFILCVPAPSVV
jgi:hypothetical protein